MYAVFLFITSCACVLFGGEGEGASSMLRTACVLDEEGGLWRARLKAATGMLRTACALDEVDTPENGRCGGVVG
jgi:hypothetical protein